MNFALIVLIIVGGLAGVVALVVALYAVSHRSPPSTFSFNVVRSDSLDQLDDRTMLKIAISELVDELPDEDIRRICDAMNRDEFVLRLESE